MSVVLTGDDRLVALAEGGRRLSSATTLEDLYPLATELALEVLGASSASLARIEHDRGILRVLRNAGELAAWEQPAPQDETYEITDFPLLAATVENARAWVGDLGDPLTGDAHRERLTRMGMASSISLPLIVHDTVWGEVGAARRAGLPSFGPGDIAAGEAFCGLLSAALTRIAERDELLGLAYRDALTGLGNRRAVDDHLEELLSSESARRNVAVVLCDVNGLKQVNDNHGHDAGDRLLRQVGGLLSRMASTVPGCLAARLGGDEFCLLIEDITEIDLQRLTERLAEEAGALPLGAGLSCGWARAQHTPGDGHDARDAGRALLRLADAAQYRAKRSGRDALAGISPADSENADPAEAGARIVADALVRLRRCSNEVEERLEAVAKAVAEVVDASGWCVSVSVDRGPVTIVRNADVRRDGWPGPEAFEPGTGFDLDDYPATSAALRGGTFHATLASGHQSEREFLASNGYDEIIGAGTQVDARHAWLVEILGDAISVELGPHRGLLRALVALAVAEGAAARPPRWFGRVDQVGSTAC